MTALLYAIYCVARNVKAIIPNRSNRKQPYSFDAVAYKRRNVVEKTLRPLKDTPQKSLSAPFYAG